MLTATRIAVVAMVTGTLAACVSTDQYIPTPDGFVHRSCVRKLKRGERINAYGVVTHADGRKEQLAQCKFPRLDAHTRQAIDSPKGQWVESAWLLAPLGVGSLSVTFTVPPAPLQKGALIYLFPGIEDSLWNILQPVLQHGPSPEFPSNEGWMAASWYCCPIGWVHHTEAIAVSPGDVLNTTISSTCSGDGCQGNPLAPCSGQPCNWVVTTSATSGGSVSLPADNVSSIFQSVAGGALEEYGLTDCMQLPGSPTTFTDITVRGQNGQIAVTNWAQPGPIPSGLPPCGYRVSTSANSPYTVTLKY